MDLELFFWWTDYLTARPQSVPLQKSASETVLCRTGVPQGPVLSPFLFSLYISDSDDSAVVGCIWDGCEEVQSGTLLTGVIIAI